MNTTIVTTSLGTSCFLVLISASLMAQVAIPISPPSQQGLLKQGTLLNPADLPQHLAALHEGLGSRLATPEKAQLTVSGTLTDSDGSRPAELIFQSPGFLAFRDNRGRALFFNETGFQGLTQNSASDNAIVESLLAHFPDTLLLQAAGSGTLRRIGSHFRGVPQDNEPIPSWTVFAYSPDSKPNLTRGGALQQELFIAIDEITGLPADIKTITKVGSMMHVVQTQLSGWTRQSGQWCPGRIVRLEDGQQRLRFDVVSASVGPALPLTAFKP